MVWSVFNYLLTQKLPRKAKVALGCSAAQKVAENAKSCSKVTEHNLFMPTRLPMPAFIFQLNQFRLSCSLDHDNIIIKCNIIIYHKKIKVMNIFLSTAHHINQIQTAMVNG